MQLVARVALFTVCVPGTVIGFVPWWMLHRRPETFAAGDPRGVAGVLLLAIGLSIYFVCATEFARRGRGTPGPYDPPRALVVSGLYRNVRNPMYLGVVAALSGIALAWRSPAVAIYAAALFTGFHVRVVGFEERELRRRFGDAYRDYCAAVPRWLPRRAGEPTN